MVIVVPFYYSCRLIFLKGMQILLICFSSRLILPEIQYSFLLRFVILLKFPVEYFVFFPFFHNFVKYTVFVWLSVLCIRKFPGFRCYLILLCLIVELVFSSFSKNAIILFLPQILLFCIILRFFLFKGPYVSCSFSDDGTDT